MEINEIFSAQGKSTWHILCEQDIGYYIPAYQREYSWGKDNIDRLFEDTAHGLKLLLDKKDSITFIGTIITIHDTKCQTVEPIIKPDMPGKVMLIIDGQQRLVTLSLLFTIFHEIIRLGSGRFENDENESSIWIYNKAQEICSALEKTFQIDKVHGQEDGIYNFKYYPRIIRSLEDSWSRKKNYAKYTSPVARYLFEYLNHVNFDPKKPYRYKIPDDADNIVAKHKVVSSNLRTIKKIINDISNDKNPDHEMPSIEQILGSKAFQEILFQDEIPDPARTELLDSSVDPKKRKYKSLFRIIVLAKFIMDRMALTVVSAKNEDYAFDMFEALNTTGEPLTAFETFKPKVIQAEGLQEYESSKSREYMQSIEEYLDVFKNAQAKQKATTGILIPFALAETGFKLSKRLSDQRRYLKEVFERIVEIDDKRNIVRHLAHTSIFIRSSWPDNKSIPPSIEGHDSKDIDLELMCLDLLRLSGHSITIAPIVRFYSLLRTAACADGRAKALSELKDAIRAVAAFSVLWRASRVTTEQIDSHYRKLMDVGITEIGVPPMARTPQGGGAVKPTAEKLKQGLRYLLKEKGGIESCSDWTKKAWKQPAYTINRPICRFLILAATHDTVPDDKNPGLVKEAKSGRLDMLNLKQWRREEEMTIEHIAPQSPQDDPDNLWDEKIYEDPAIPHCLGNLTLLPRIENSLAGNNSWDEKRAIYKVLSAGDEDEHNQRLNEAKKKGIEIKASAEKILNESQYLPHVNAIGNIEEDWSLNHIEIRSKRVAKIAWNRLAPWLGLAGDTEGSS